VHDTVLQSGLDVLFYAVPLLLALIIGFFRLDEFISSPDRKDRSRRPVAGYDTNGEPLLSDPDGRPWKHTRAAS
jgi:hypothetical protein